MARRSPPSTPSFEGPLLCSEPSRALEALGWYMGNHGHKETMHGQAGAEVTSA